MPDTISLEGLEFFAYHGFHDEERKMGNKYGIDITVHTDLSGASVNDSLQATVDYEMLYKIIKKEVEKPSKLLETIARRILESVFQHFPQIHTAEVNVSKFNPPVGGICHRAKVCIRSQR